MPPYSYLFEKRRISGERSVDALSLEGDRAPESGYEIVPTMHQLIQDYVKAGKLRIVYKPVTFVHPPYSNEAAAAAICAAQQGQFMEMYDQILTSRPKDQKCMLTFTAI